MQDLVAGGIDIVTCSIPEARAMLDAKRARSLAIMAETRHPNFPDVPTLGEALGLNHQTGAWRGIAAPRGLPAEQTATLIAALDRAYKSKQYVDFMNSRGFGMVWAPGVEFAAMMAESDKAMGAAMRAAGLAKA